MTTFVAFSGGLDSTVLAHKIMLEEEPVGLITTQYGSLHSAAETLAAEMVIRWFQENDYPVQLHTTIKLPEIFAIGKSSLMGTQEMPDAEYEVDGPSPTVVPFRNANIISAVTAFAVQLEGTRVAAAMHASDWDRWAYPDCSPEFLGPMAAVVYAGTMHQIRLYTPFLYMTKADIVTLGAEQGTPMEFTWSCYRGGTEHCGTCPTCRERKQAFDIAGVPDYTNYKE